jgi:hypothetical protein
MLPLPPYEQAIFGDEYCCISSTGPVKLNIKLREPGSDEDEGPVSRLFSLQFTLPKVGQGSPTCCSSLIGA